MITFESGWCVGASISDDHVQKGLTDSLKHIEIVGQVGTWRTFGAWRTGGTVGESVKSELNGAESDVKDAQNRIIRHVTNDVLRIVTGSCNCWRGRHKFHDKLSRRPRIVVQQMFIRS